MSWPDIIHALQTSVPTALLALGSTLGALIAAIVKISKSLEDGKRKRDTDSVRPSQSPTELSQRLDALTRRVDTGVWQMALMQSQWREQDLAERVSQLEKELREAREDLEQARKLAADERMRRQKAERELARLRALRG